MDFNYDVERLVMERGSAFNQPPKRTITHSASVYAQDNYETGVGEITGEEFGTEDMEPGMPFRPKTTTTTERYQIDQDMGSPYIDFNVFKKQPTRKFEYNDQTNISFSDINTNQTVLPQETNRFPGINNQFTMSFFVTFVKSLKTRKSIVLSPFSILQAFCLLYIGSRNKTEAELRQYL